MSAPEHRPTPRCTCGAPAEYEPALEQCAKCAMQYAVDHDDAATAYAIAAECGYSAMTVRRMLRDEADRRGRAAMRAARALRLVLEGSAA